MADLYEKIKELEGVERLSKHELLITGILGAIEDKILIHGNQLPSVNQMVRNLGFARKTIVKAYKELIERGIIESRNRIGYFLTNESTEQTIKIALLLYAYHTFQEIFYNTFRTGIGENVQLDVYFHHNNPVVYRNTLANIKNKYGMYVVAPIQSAESKKLLKNFSPNKLLIVDRDLKPTKDYSYVVQEFDTPLYEALKSLQHRIKAFDELIILFRGDSDSPMDILRGFKRYVKEFKIKSRIIANYVPGSVEKGKVYLITEDTPLWNILKDCEQKQLELGKDVGIVSQDESPIKEIICGGITTFSTDFELMAQKAADFVLNRVPIQEVIPSVLIRRKSL